LKRLMGRYASGEEEVDFLLRSKRFVDLYSVVRHGLRASVESYSIKKLEPLYDYERGIALSDANVALAKVQAGLELDDAEFTEDSDRKLVAGYNRDDCLSTLGLRDWLERRRDSLMQEGSDVPRPEIPDGEPSEQLSERQQRINALITRLTADVPINVNERSAEQHARWLLAYSLDWHRREQKAAWWEYLRLRDLAAEDLLDERAAISGLTFVGATGGTAKAPIHRYSFPPQETELRGDESLHSVGGGKLGTVHDISLEERWVDIKKRCDSADIHPEAVFAHKVIDGDVLADSLERIGAYVADHGMEGDGPHPAARDLLMRLPPRIGGQSIHVEGEAPLDAALRIVPTIAGGVFPIQGPPGSGKTYNGARMICALVAQGKTVGVTATSHKVIRNLLDEVLKADWFDNDKVERPIALSDIVIIAPYNAQVFQLQERLPGARIGTVDKFQGQEAPIVIYSLTTSSYVDAHRDMEFLYSLNRLNVATSRAKCLCILVASPSVFEAQCRTPRQVQLANAFCRYPELATTPSPATDSSAMRHVVGRHRSLSEELS
jgi:uncharacterized protein